MRRNIPNLPEQAENDQQPGSPTSGEPVFLAVGKLRRAHGIDGEILMDVLTDFPERLNPGRTVYVGEKHEPRRISHIRWQDRAILISFENINDSDQAGLFRNQFVYVSANSLPPLPEGEYYHHQLLGLAVVDDNGQPIGSLKEILETGANDVYVVKSSDGKEILLPAIESVILEVNLERREIRIRSQEWL